MEENNKIEKIFHEYRDDLPTTGHAFEENSRWERQWKALRKENQPDSVAKAFKFCDMDLYPNICVLLKIRGTIAVTSRECERFESVLKRLYYLSSSNGSKPFQCINIDAY